LLDGRFTDARDAAARARVIADDLGDPHVHFLCTVHDAISATAQMRRLPAGLGEAFDAIETHRMALRVWLAADAADLVQARAALTRPASI
jgi:hypothetical protein